MGDKIDIFKDIYNVENLSFYKIKRIIFNNKVSESYILFENKLFLVLFEDNTLFSYEIENFEISNKGNIFIDMFELNMLFDEGCPTQDVEKLEYELSINKSYKFSKILLKDGDLVTLIGLDRIRYFYL